VVDDLYTRTYSVIGQVATTTREHSNCRKYVFVKIDSDAASVVQPLRCKKSEWLIMKKVDKEVI